MSDLISGIGGMHAARAQSADLKQQARMEGVAAKDRELERTRRLREVLSSNRASAAARGVAQGGSAGVINAESVTRFKEDQESDKAQTSYRIGTLRARAKAARRAGKFGLVGGALKSAAKAAASAGGAG